MQVIWKFVNSIGGGIILIINTLHVKFVNIAL